MFKPKALSAKAHIPNPELLNLNAGAEEEDAEVWTERISGSVQDGAFGLRILGCSVFVVLGIGCWCFRQVEGVEEAR